MQQNIQNTLTAAKSAQGTLLGNIDATADALDAVGRDPLTEALQRLREAADGAKARLASGRDEALSILGDFATMFADFEDEITAEPITVRLPALPAPAPTMAQEATQAEASPEATPTVSETTEASQEAEQITTTEQAPETTDASETLTATAANPATEEAPAAVLTPAPAAEEEPASTEPALLSEAQLRRRNKAELEAYAASIGVDLDPDLTKREIIDAIVTSPAYAV